MSGFPLKPGIHELKTVVDVDDDDFTRLWVYGPDGEVLLRVEGTLSEFMTAYLKASHSLNVATYGR